MQPKMIYDTIHGNIELTELEAVLLKSSILNRLHQVLQNSTAYLVFPCCRTSRFEHSVGVMDYASEIFLCGLNNSPSIKNEYLDDKANLIARLIKDDEEVFMKYHRKNANNEENPYAIKQFLSKLLPNEENPSDLTFDRFIKEDNICKELNQELIAIIGENIVEKKLGLTSHEFSPQRKFAYLVLFQSVRLFGLLHDIGHLPFSHVFEHAIEAMAGMDYENEGKPNDKDSPITKLKGLVKGDINLKIHESIGIKIAIMLINELKLNNNKENSLSEKKRKIRYIIYCCLEICYQSIIDKTLSSLYGIVSGTIDADRIDFIQRDGFVSGVSNTAGNIDRIVKLFILKKFDKSDNVDSYSFMPAFQSLHDVEKLLLERFSVYKYMVNHHAVKRSDYILQKNIENLFLEELRSKKSGFDINNPNSIIGIIKIIHSLLFDERTELHVKLYRLSQLTDFRLLSIFSQKYIESKILKKSDRSSVGVRLLSEIYESKRSFISLWKRIYNYETFLIKVAKEHIGKIDYKGLRKNDYLNAEIIKLENENSKYEDLLIKAKLTDSEYKQIGRYVISLMKALYKKSWCRKIEEKIKEKINENGLKLTIFVVNTNISNGVIAEKSFADESGVVHTLIQGDLFLIDNRDRKKVLKIEEMSTVPYTLYMEEKLAMQCFAYYQTTEKGIGQAEIESIIINAIYSLINEKLTTINRKIN